MGMRVWLLQEAGTKAGRDVEDFLRGNGFGTKWEGRGESQARCTSAPSEGAREAISLTSQQSEEDHP